MASRVMDAGPASMAPSHASMRACQGARRCRGASWSRDSQAHAAASVSPVSASTASKRGVAMTARRPAARSASCRAAWRQQAMSCMPRVSAGSRDRRQLAREVLSIEPRSPPWLSVGTENAPRQSESLAESSATTSSSSRSSAWRRRCWRIRGRRTRGSSQPLIHCARSSDSRRSRNPSSGARPASSGSEDRTRSSAPPMTFVPPRDGPSEERRVGPRPTRSVLVRATRAAAMGGLALRGLGGGIGVAQGVFVP